MRLNPSAQMRMLDGFNGQDRILGKWQADDQGRTSLGEGGAALIAGA